MCKKRVRKTRTATFICIPHRAWIFTRKGIIAASSTTLVGLQCVVSPILALFASFIATKRSPDVLGPAVLVRLYLYNIAAAQSAPLLHGCANSRHGRACAQIRKFWNTNVPFPSLWRIVDVITFAALLAFDGTSRRNSLRTRTMRSRTRTLHALDDLHLLLLLVAAGQIPALSRRSRPLGAKAVGPWGLGRRR